MSKITNIYKQPKVLYLSVFIFTFILYVFYGLCISYMVKSPYNDIFFGADSARAFRDLALINSNHYRIAVHPLLLILIEPITLIINGIVNYSLFSVIILESFAGALFVVLFMALLDTMRIDKEIVFIFTLILLFSFSNIIFSTIPETFIFAGLGLVAFWYTIMLASTREGDFLNEELFLIVVFGVICFGITLTNYFSYFVGLIYIIWHRTKKIRDMVKKLIIINFINGVVIFVLCILQRFIWTACPLFWTSILESFKGEQYEETLYMNWAINFDKSVVWIKNLLLYPLASPNIQINVIEETGNYKILFSEYSVTIKIFLIIFYIFCILSVVNYIINMVKKYHCKRQDIVIAMFIAYLGNAILHYIYGSYEAFIYSPHYLFLMLILIAVSINSIESRITKKVYLIILMLFVIMQAINNGIQFFNTTNIAMQYAGAFYSIKHSIKGAVMVGGFTILACLGGFYLNIKYSIKISAPNYDEKIKLFCRNIIIYFCLILICGLFIAFTYRTVIVYDGI